MFRQASDCGKLLLENMQARNIVRRYDCGVNKYLLLAANFAFGLDFAAVGTAINQNDDLALGHVSFRHRFVGMVVH
jgi:hypothetical protein